MDTFAKKWNTLLEVNTKKGKQVLEVKPPEAIKSSEFDRIIIASLSQYDDIFNLLCKDYEIPAFKIDNSFSKICVLARINFLRSFSYVVKESQLKGCVAELGVFKGEFAKFINKYFEDRKLFLFDTFEGFDERDLKSENKQTQKLGIEFKNTSMQLVESKMPYAQNVIFKKGWFPQSAAGLEDEKFCFVNLDADLYEPILAGLEFFYPKMTKGGVILIHDYFYDSDVGYPGVKKAVSEFCLKNNISFMPIGDEISIAIQKN